ncbi:phospholipase A2 inhibitor CgMIP-I-like [Discoglossus pictus]
MTSFSFTLYVLCTLFASVYGGTKCQTAYCRNSKSCEESVQECGGDSKCFTLSEHFEVEGQIYPTLYKNCCSPHMPCDDQASCFSDQSKVRITVDCCDGDNCNNGQYKIADQDENSNSVICKSCFKKGSLDECISDQMQACKGPENLCYEYIGTLEIPDGQLANYSVKGCISPLGCQYSFSLIPGVIEKQRVKFVCGPDI